MPDSPETSRGAKRPFLIIVAVTGYSLLETALLLAYLLPEEMFVAQPGPRQTILSLIQFLTIPGMAALFSLILYGRRLWKRRMISLFLTVPGFLLLFLLIASPVGLLEWILMKRGSDPGASQLFAIAVAVWQIVLPATLLIALFFMFRRRGKSTIESDAFRWLADRQLLVARRNSRKRAIGLSLWIPLLIVLAVSLFLPEVWGVFTHCQRPRAGELIGYRVPIPLTWVILFRFRSNDPADGLSGIYGMAGRGLGLGVGPYLRYGGMPLSSWEVRTKPFRQFKEPATGRWTLRGYRVIGQRDFLIGSSSLRCLEYSSSDRKVEQNSESSTVYIECSSSRGLSAILWGEKIHVPAFYRMLGGIAEVK